MLLHKFILQEQEGTPTTGGNAPAPAAPVIAAPPVAAAPAASVAAPTAAPAAEAKPAWADNWRQEIAGDNADHLKTLERFTSPKAMYESYAALRQKMSSGELKPVTAFPAKGTTEEQTAWRQANGIPDAPDKYDLNMGDGRVIGEDDKPVIDDFLKSVHAQNAAPDTVKAAIGWYLDNKVKAEEQRAEADRVARQTNEDALRSQWGGDFRRNINMIDGLLDTAPQGVKDKFLGGRLADGTLIGNDKDTLEFLAGLALQINPATTLVPGASNVGYAIGDEISKYEGMMGNRSSEYWKGPSAEKNQARYRDLVAARDRMK